MARGYGINSRLKLQIAREALILTSKNKEPLRAGYKALAELYDLNWQTVAASVAQARQGKL